jgi:putative ABC transport system permease protein
MFSNYLLVALYNVRRQSVFSAVKVLSLAIGLGCSILVIMHVQYAYSFDKHFPNWQNIYRVVTSLTLDSRMDTELSSEAVAQRLRVDYPQIEHAAVIWADSDLFSRGDVVGANPYAFADGEFLAVFSPEFVGGDAATALDEPYSVVIDETTAAKYFGSEEALGQTLTLRNLKLKVTGVIRNLPKNTHLPSRILMSTATARAAIRPDFMSGNDWNDIAVTTYISVSGKAAADAINADLPAFLQRNLPDDQKDYAQRSDMTLSLQPLGDIYLSRRQGNGQGTNNRGKIIAALSVFGALILLTSCINFANLAFSQVRQRGKEIGVRKTLGAKRRDIVLQFLTESLLLTLLALCLALPLVWLAVAPYTALTGTDFGIADAMNARSITTLVCFVLLTGLLSGLLPALSLARQDPAAAIKGSAPSNEVTRLARSGVTVVQFGFSTALILLALAITLQIRHLNTMDLGFDKDDLLLLEGYPQAANNLEAMVNALRQHPGIIAVAKTNRLPPYALAPVPWRASSMAPEQNREVTHIMADEHYLDAMQLRLLAGRWFSAEFPADFIPVSILMRGPQSPPVELPQPMGVVITRTAARLFGLGTPFEAIDEQLLSGADAYRVIGVVEDFHMSGGLEDPLNSVMIIRSTQVPIPVMGALLLRFDPAQTDAALAHVDAAWQQYRPDIAIDRRFFRQTYNALVDLETRGINIAAIFASVISITISAFGLYALAFHSAQRRTKEVAVRKVLGATPKQIIRLLTWDFLKPVLMACALASFAAYYAILYYLQQFASRTEVPWLLYFGVSSATLLLAALTVATQCHRAAKTDPVQSLRCE